MLQSKNGATKATGTETNKKLRCPWPRGAARAERLRGGRGGQGAGHASDRQGHEAVVLLDVALEDVGARAEDALEPRPVQLDALQWAAGHHGGCAGPVHQQGDLAWRERGLRAAHSRNVSWRHPQAQRETRAGHMPSAIQKKQPSDRRETVT